MVVEAISNVSFVNRCIFAKPLNAVTTLVHLLISAWTVFQRAVSQIELIFEDFVFKVPIIMNQVKWNACRSPPPLTQYYCEF